MKKKKNGSKTAPGGSRRKREVKAPRPKPETDIVLLGELEEAVSRLAESPRFDFLKNLIVAEFTDSRKAIPLEGLTFGDLSDRLRTTESLGDDIARLSPADHQKLLKTISDLGGLEAPQPPPTLPESAPRAAPERAPQPEAPILSSVEAERRLTDAISALKSAPNFHLIKFSRLGDFWQEGWQRAPFEEALTLQQITEMKVPVMLEKRSFGPTKIFNFVRAIERAVGGDRIPLVTNGVAPIPAQSNIGAAPSAPHTPSFWTPPGVKLPAHATATLRYLENLAATTAGDAHPLARVLTRLPSVLTAPETAVAWLRQDSDNDIVASLMHLSPLATIDFLESANNKLTALFREVAPSESRSWLLALQSPGISLEELLSVYPATTLPAEASAALGRMILAALGATHPQIFGQKLNRYYTVTADAAELVINNIVRNLPQADEQVTKELRALAPFIDPEELRPLLLLRAMFNERARMWSKK